MENLAPVTCHVNRIVHQMHGLNVTMISCAQSIPYAVTETMQVVHSGWITPSIWANRLWGAHDTCAAAGWGAVG